MTQDATTEPPRSAHDWAKERRRPVFPRTVGEVARTLLPWAALWAGLMLLQLVLVVTLEDMPLERLLLDERTVFQRYRNGRPTDGLFSVITLLCTAIGIGASVLTTTLGHLRRDDRQFAAAISGLYLLLAAEEQLQLHTLLAWEGRADDVLVLALIVGAAVAIGVAWPSRVVRVWPLIVVAGAAQVSALLLNAFTAEGPLEEWLELLGAVFLAGLAISLTRHTVMEAMARRRSPAEGSGPTAGVSRRPPAS